ncbi:MAG: hypothetical protein ACKOC5_00940 [Chloroflexota bacterium]
MNSLSRSTAIKIAAGVSFILNLFSAVAGLLLLPAGASANNSNPESIPYGVLMLGTIMGVIGIVAAYGAWKQQRWGVVLTILVNLVNGLSAAPGILFAPTTPLFISALATVVGGVIIIVLCLWPGRQAAAV